MEGKYRQVYSLCTTTPKSFQGKWCKEVAHRCLSQCCNPGLFWRSSTQLLTRAYPSLLMRSDVITLAWAIQSKAKLHLPGLNFRSAWHRTGVKRARKLKDKNQETALGSWETFCYCGVGEQNEQDDIRLGILILLLYKSRSVGGAGW